MNRVGLKQDVVRTIRESKIVCTCVICSPDLADEILETVGEHYANRLDVESLVEGQREWSRRTFGEGRHTRGVVAHIRKELDEILAKPDDVVEWVDVVLLALDGAWRHGHEPAEIVAAIRKKRDLNEAREWPPVGSVADDEPIEHVEAPPRCDVCGWPLRERSEDGCTAGSCSYRPEVGSPEYMRIQERRKRLVAEAEPVKP